jgi:trans-aconitate methyltransferase
LDYSKFYTPPEIAELLVNRLEVAPPDSVIDICCGSCNLLHAAIQRWHKAKLFGVDIINHTVSDVHSIQSDGRKYAIEHSECYPLVLANPPFDYVERKKEFPDLYKDFPFEYVTSRLEIEMLLANLRLLRNNGTLMIIMPSTFINAESHIKIRKYLAGKYYIKEIIHLPDCTFGTAKINSYALIINRSRSHNSYTKLFYVTFENGKYSVSEVSEVPQQLILAGKWDEVLTPKNSPIRLEYKRGNISSHYFITHGLPILHTAKLQNPWKPSVRYVSEFGHNSVYAENGDIIVSRIGKSAGQWYKYIGEKILISDCLYCIKDPHGIVVQKLKGQIYSYPIKGVATRYITMSDFDAWYSSL